MRGTEFSHLSPNANIIFAEIVKALFYACRYLCHRLGLFLRRAPLFFALLAGVAAITVVDGGYALRAMLVSLAIGIDLCRGAGVPIPLPPPRRWSGGDAPARGAASRAPCGDRVISLRLGSGAGTGVRGRGKTTREGGGGSVRLCV